MYLGAGLQGPAVPVNRFSSRSPHTPCVTVLVCLFACSLDSWVVKFLRLLKQHEFQEHWDGARSAAGPDVKREWRCGADYNFHGVHYVLEERATSDAVNAVVHVIHNHLKRLYVSLRTQVRLPLKAAMCLHLACWPAAQSVCRPMPAKAGLAC